MRCITIFLSLFMATSSMAQEQQRTIVEILTADIMRRAQNRAIEHGITEGTFFSLWNDCQPVSVVIGTFRIVENRELSEYLTREDVESSIRGRLRTARLYNPVPPSRRVHNTTDFGELGGVIAVDVMVNSIAVYLRIEYRRLVMDRTAEFHSYAASWWHHDLILGGFENLAFIPITLRSMTDDFIDQYLGANALACKGPSP